MPCLFFKNKFIVEIFNHKKEVPKAMSSFSTTLYLVKNCVEVKKKEFCINKIYF